MMKHLRLRKAALEHFNQGCKECSLVLSDIRMPEMNGFEFVRKIRKLKPDIKILFMTAFEINQSEFEQVLPSTKVEGFIKSQLDRKRSLILS